MKFCPVVPEICRGQVHVPKKERRRKRIIIIIKKIIIIRNGVKTISLQTLFGRLNYVRHQQGLGVFSTYSLLVYISLGSLQYYIYIDSV
jgi:hypothetical protein